jgi:subtilisin family serine protease
VIVRMDTGETIDSQVIEAISEGIHRRALSTTARDVLPAPAASLGTLEEMPTRSQSRELARADKSVSAQLAGRALTLATTFGLQQLGLGALVPLMESEIVRKLGSKIVQSLLAGAIEPALAQQSGGQSSTGAVEAQPARARAAHDPFIPLWASNSAVLTLDRDDLHRLPAEVPQIQDIFPNRELVVPPVVSPQSLPQAVEDNKACAWGLETIGGLATWGAYGARGRDIVVGILDTGVDAEHPDLKDKVKHWAEFDRGGREVAGSRRHDSGEHGTHCAGTICGGRESGRWIGVAPDAKLAAALVLNGKRGSDAQILAGLQWAIAKGVDVISMSLGGLTLGPEVPNTYEIEIYNALRVGIPVVSAIGNWGGETSDSPGNDFLSFSVGATDHRDRAAGFSGGRTHVVRQSRVLAAENLPLVYSKPNLSAPGVAVYSSVPGGKWKAANGTSMATPHVAGAMALLLSATGIREKLGKTILAANVIQDLLIGSVEELGEAGQDHRYGYGRLDILRAIGFAKALGY